MKILLVAINAKYVHSNLAIYTLRSYARLRGIDIEIAEYTINNYQEEIMADIYKKKPDFIGFSCYIWNIDYVEAISRELKKVLPCTHIWFGGPEVSFNSEDYLKNHGYVDGIMIGEGEETICEVIRYYQSDNQENIKKNIDNNELIDKLKECDICATTGITLYDNDDDDETIEKDDTINNKDIKDIKDIKGIVTRNGDEIINTGMRNYMNMDDVPFVYEDLSEFENRIIYYESSRGCPYSCSYCMSSIDKRVRFRSMDLVKKELQFFLDNKVSQVKFVDRTFNCNKERTKDIWNYIKEHDNGITNFHFEVSADILSDEEIELMKDMRPRLIQLEIGVQSTNLQTIDAIKRKMDFDRLSDIVKKINETKKVHQHLDLIAGLPYEGMDSFKKSFNDVYGLEPEQLQLGFLKVLKGSLMHSEAEKYGIVYKTNPVYEVLYTNWLSYDEILKLKQIEEMVEVYYNSRQFENTMKYIQNFFETPFDMYEYFASYYDRHNLFDIKHNRIARYNILIDMFKNITNVTQEEISILLDLLKHDLYLREKIKTRPEWAELIDELKKRYNEFYKDEEAIRKILPNYNSYDTKQIARLTNIESYSIDVIEYVEHGVMNKQETYILYDYLERNPINYQASIKKVFVK